MFARTKVDFFFVMATSLAVLGVLRALKIDGQLTTIKNDCYERLAIGQRHNQKDIYKTSHVTTVFECQLFCTDEKDLCKSFSFGIGVKGNASCELSGNVIKETADLKPIGTKADTDYDLYIKKLGCTLVIDKNNPAFDHYRPQNKPSGGDYKPSDKPEQGSSYGGPNKPPDQIPSYGGNAIKPVHEYEKPSESGYNPPPSKPPNNGYGTPGRPTTDGGYGSPVRPPIDSGYGSPARPTYNKPYEEVQHVQTLVSVSSGPPKPILDSYHEMLAGVGPYNYAKPPFRPSALNNPYDRPKPDNYGSRPHRPDYDRPHVDNNYGPKPLKPDYDRPNSGNYGSRPQRPEYERPDLDRYDLRPGESNTVPNGHRPIPDKYASYIPRPDHYNDYYKPRPDNYYRPNGNNYDRPNPSDYYKPMRPSDDYNWKPRPPLDDYNSRPRPPLDEYGSRPHPSDYNSRPRPPVDYDRPSRPVRPGLGSGYDRPDYIQRPHRPDRPPDYDRPNPAIYGPKPPSNGYDRPSNRPDRPNPSNYETKPPTSGYDKPSNRPDRPDYDRPSSLNYETKPPSSGYDRPPNRPDRPDYDRPSSPNYETKPSSSGYDKPPNRPDRPDYDRPSSPNYEKPPSSGYDRPPNHPDYEKPKPPSNGYDSAGNNPNQYHRPSPPSSNYDRPNPPSNYDSKPSSSNNYYNRPSSPTDSYKDSRPTNEYLFHGDVDRYDPNPERPSQIYQKPSISKPSGGYDNSIKGSYKPKDPHSKPIVTQSIGPHGESITSIITQLDEACFRRVLAGKRVTRALVKRALFCERVEDCQRECADEKRFACEGFNYRLDPTGRGKGECELLEIPLSHLDIGRDLYPDPDYDYYERDRNAASVNCKGHGYYPSSGGYDGYYNRRHDQRPYDWWNDDRRYGYGNRRPRPDYGFDSRPSYGYDGYRPNGNRRGDFAYHDSHHSNHPHNYHYEHYDHGPPSYDYKSYEPYLPNNRRPFYNDDRHFHQYDVDRERDKSYWGFDKPTWAGYGGSYGTNYNPYDFEKRNYYLPPPPEGNKLWGQYGGSYGNGGLNLQYNGYGHSQSFDFWGLNKYEEKFHNYGELPPKKPPGGESYLPGPPYKPPINNGGPSYLPELPPPKGSGSYLPELPKPPIGGSYLPEPDLKPPFSHGGGSYLPERPFRPPVNTGSYLPSPGKPSQDNDIYNNAILPAEPRYPYYYDYLKDECSLRSAAGFRLSKGIVKKFVSVPNIYECELLCFKEKEFPCASYAYRYTGTVNGPIENCYLSNRNYKELDFYTDLEPDRNFDVYTMNNMKRCEQPLIRGRDDSDCFWRVRSAQRLDQKVIRDSLVAKSIVECQIACLRSIRFTCRAFSFRYGSPVIGRPVENCLLTDWPYYEMDPKIYFVPEPGFEIYERGSFGHGCEPHHFGIKGKPWKNTGTRIDQLCYIGFGSPARLLPQATRKQLQVATEEQCKTECSKFRENTLFQCMSLSYNNKSPKWEPNCMLSDILQRDLLPNVDYVPDPDAWLFAWDNYNPECRAIANKPIHNHIDHREDRYDDYDIHNAIGTWRVYSVSGWPCRRGTLCRENKVAGFWYCELEGGDSSTWDYCCRPDHQCGFSEGFAYQWCYVGPARTQWRKCSDRYYPYIHNLIDRFDRPPPSHSHWPSGGHNYLPDHRPPPPPPPPHRPGSRPDRPSAPPTPPPPYPSLDEYEMQFESQFLDPPKPGGFGQPRHWPLSYLHKEMPPNNTDSDSRLMKASKGETNPKFAAIQNLIDVIKSNDLKNVQYQITNDSNKEDDILFVKIPLPTNFTEGTKKSEKVISNGASVISDPIDLNLESKNNTKRSQKSLPPQDRLVTVYRRSYITRTNVTNHRRARTNPSQ